jgi:indolepyruvate ferredoxin oxidoreductase beta subunit
MNAAASPFCILIAALGGEGGGVLADWLVECALEAGLPVQATSVPGVAQRTGATSYYIELMRETLASGAPAPVFALTPVPGCVDVVVASELLEAARMLERGFVTRRTTLVASTHRVYTTIEKMHMDDGRQDAARMQAAARALAVRAVLLDMEAVTVAAGTVISAVMFGALAGAGVLPWPRAACERAIRASGKGVEASLAGFARAFDAASAVSPQDAAPGAPAGVVTSDAGDDLAGAPTGAFTRAAAGAAAGAAQPDGAVLSAPAAEVIAAAARSQPSVRAQEAAWSQRLAPWPAAVQLIAAHGALRCLDYQDAAYAGRYLDAVAELAQAAGAAGHTAARGAAPDAANAAAHSSVPPRAAEAAQAHAAQAPALEEAVRQLALWMCFEDVIRVADLKSRRSRYERVRAEVQAGAADVVRITEHFKPGLDEVAAVLPRALGARLLAWGTRTGRLGRSHVGLHIRSTSLWGYLMLRFLARLRPLRPRSLRFAQEHEALDAWLGAMQQVLALDAPPAAGFALALAGLPQVLKGYGDTQVRGRQNYARLWTAHVAPALAGEHDVATAGANLKEALRQTLADPEGRLNAAAAATPSGAAAQGTAAGVRPQPVFWARSPSAAQGSGKTP